MISPLPNPAPGPLLKLCGFTDERDLALAARLGVWALGLILAPSPRRVPLERAARLTSFLRRTAGRNRPLVVGVFVEENPELIESVVRRVGLDGVQLHGAEPVSYAADLRLRLPEAVLIKMLPVAAASGGEGHAPALKREAEAYLEHVDYVLLDTSVGGRAGGTGTTFDWIRARSLTGLPVLVAGGITPENAVDALRQTGATGLDVCGGVEAGPGRKDEDAVRRLVRAVEGAAADPKSSESPLRAGSSERAGRGEK
ncbi:MAG: phosphoribosylanthranilate isomerase [Thermoleophilia bacterium]